MNTVSKPMLFSSPMILALLDGSKTMTRRIQSLNEKTVLTAAMRRIGFEFCPDQARYDYPVANMLSLAQSFLRRNGHTQKPQEELAL